MTNGDEEEIQRQLAEVVWVVDAIAIKQISVSHLFQTIHSVIIQIIVQLYKGIKPYHSAECVDQS
jgi:hypothetical protein